MINVICRVILFTSLLMLSAVIPASAAIPVPSEVTDDIVEPEQTELDTQKAELLIRRDSLKLNVAIHNAKCSKVSPGSSVVDECRTNQAALRAEISDYAADVHAFNTMALEAPRILDAPEYTPTLSEYVIKYFLIYREESYKINNEIIEDSTVWQDRLHEEIRKFEEGIVLSPANQKKFNETNQSTYSQRDSDIERINSLSLENMIEEMERLKQEGYYKDGDDLIDKDNNDPDFQNAINEAVRNVLIRQYEAEYLVQQTALNEIRSTASELRIE